MFCTIKGIEQRKQMYRKKLLIAFAVSLLIGIAAYSFFLPTFFAWYLKGYCRTCLNGELTYDSFRQENGKWVILNPRFATSKLLEDGGYRFIAQKADVDLAISWLERNIEFAISLTEPHFDVAQGAQELKSAFLFPNQSFSFFNVHTSFNIPYGSFRVHELSYNNSKTDPVFFSVSLACKESKEGCLRLWFDELIKQGNSNHLEALFSEPDPQTSRLFIKAKDFDCNALMLTLRNIWPTWLTCEIIQGSVNGEAEITLPHDAPLYASGNFIFSHIGIRHPGYEISGQIPEMTLSFSPENFKGSIRDITQTVGILDIPKNTSLDIFKAGIPFWSINNLGGKISFHTSDVIKLEMDALCQHLDKKQRLQVNGQLHLNHDDQASATLNFTLSDNPSDPATKAHFAIRQLGERWNFVEAQLSHFTQDEFDFIKNICGRLYPSWQKVNVHHGVMDATMLVYLEGLYISEVNIEKITARDLDLSIEPWNISFGAPVASGSLTFGLYTSDIIPTINSDLNIENGRFCLDGIDQAKWQFADLFANLSIRKGVIQKSLVKGEFAGMKGEAELDGTASGEIVKCSFDGKAKDILALLPRSIKEGIENKFVDDQLKIIAGLTSHPDGVFVKGKAFVSDKCKGEEIDFGFAVEKSSKAQWGAWPPDPVLSQYCSGPHLEAIRCMIPHIALPLSLAHDYWVKHKLGLAGFVIKDGWFETHHLPLEKYLSPYVFKQNQMQLSGFGDFRGTFDEQGISVRYDAQDLTLENSDFCIEVKSLSNAPDHSEKRFVGSHVIDLEKMCSFSSFPITNCTYFEKNSGLLFTDVNTLVSIEEGKGHLANVNAFCNGVFFAGNIDIDWSMPGEGIFEIDIFSDEMQGKVSQVQNLFTHFDKSLFFLKLPVEGNVAFRKNGGHLHFAFQPNDYTLNAKFEGVLSDGILSCDTGDVLLQELSLNIDYDHQASTLDFSDIQGTVLVGKPGHVEEYALAGDYIRFSNYARDEAVFDLWVGDRKRDHLRLAGRTVPNSLEANADTIDVILDQTLSHFGDAHPSSFQLTLKEWSQVESFHLGLNFHLKTLLHDLQRFSRTGFFFLSRSLLKELNELKSAQGNFDVDLAYDGNTALFTYSVIGKEVAAGSHEFKTLLFNGKKKGSTWMIDQLQLDEISLAADILKQDDVWNINFMGARFGKSLLLGLDGQYRDDDGVLEAKINLFEADLAYLDEWPIMKQIIDAYHPKGQVRATGKMLMEFDKSMPYGMRLDVLMNGSLRSGYLKGLAFQDFQNANLHFNSVNGWSIEAVKTGLLSAKDGSTQANLWLSHLNCDFLKDEIITDGLSFDVPVENLTWLSENLQQSFPDAISQPLADTIRQLKKQGSVEGKLKMEFSGPHCALNLALDNGTYHFMNKEYHLSNFILDYDPFELKISSQFRHLKQHLWVNVRSPAPALNSGEIIFSEYPLETYTSQDPYPLTVNWQLDPSHGFTLNRLEGTLCGIRLDLLRDPNYPIEDDRMFLVGEVHANMEKAVHLLNENLADACLQWQVGNGYNLKGHWVVNKDDKPLTEGLSFQGELLGRDFEFGGYQFYNLNAHIDYTSKGLQGTHISVTDPCVGLQVNELALTSQPNDTWNLSIPSIAMYGFCPSLLHVKGTPPPRISKALVIRRLDIDGFQGILGDRQSYVGKGRLFFVNPPKKNLQHTIFAIPSELLTRLGLDLAVLNPVRGMINYEIRDGRIVFTRFKDMYSKGRLSKFYLSNNGTPSYLDFDGNLNVQVRMKQYNLFFKIAELFTVTVQGTIKKPTYSLHKQPKLDRASAIKNLIKS